MFRVFPSERAIAVVVIVYSDVMVSQSNVLTAL
jgi:hypothetical protein